jgi:WD40 repeat protein
MTRFFLPIERFASRNTHPIHGSGCAAPLPHKSSREPRRRVGFAALGALLTLGFSAGLAHAQVSLRNPSQPMLVYNAAGHTAPVRSLIFVPEGGQLLSAGLDRIVNVWNTAGDRSRPVRTLRPPIGREPLGAIYAMALSSGPVAGADRLLAVGGYSPTTSSTSFILLYRFPGAGEFATGQPHKILPAIRTNDAGLDVAAVTGGVDRSVHCLAFDGKGELLASAGSDSKRAIVVWDVTRGTIRHRLVNADAKEGGIINKLALSADGKRLWSGGTDGYLRLWDLRRDVPTAFGPPIGIAAPGPGQPIPALDPKGVIVSLALAPDEKTVYVGREDGSLVAYDATTLANPRRLIAEADEKGPVDAVAVHPDARRIGLARINHHYQRDRPEELVTDCLIEIRDAVDGHVLDTAPIVPDLVRACTFSPDGNTFAYSGGESQAVYLKDLRNPRAVVEELRGEGSSFRDVGFAREGLTVGYQRRGADPNAPYEGFDLLKRRVIPINPGDLDPARSRLPLGTFRLVPRATDTIDIVSGEWKFSLTWSEPLVGRWFSYCMIPDPAGGYPTVAIGCVNTIAIFAPTQLAADKLEYVQTRQFRGHSGSITGLGVSPDRKWLVSGGVDQSLRLWSLGGSRTHARLGAVLVPQGADRLIVTEVDPDGFAKRAGLRMPDAVVTAELSALNKLYGRGGTRNLAELASDLNARAPGTPLNLIIVRDGKEWATQTRMQDEPVLSIFLTDPARTDRGAIPAEREWVVWNPDGYYDTSVTADRRFLGWHRNAPNAARSGADLYQPTGYFTIRTFEKLLRKPDVVDQLLAGKLRADALPRAGNTNEPVDIVAAIDSETPPSIRLIQPFATGARPVVVDEPRVALQFEVAEGIGEKSKLKALNVRVDGQEVSQPAIPDQRPAPISTTVALAHPGVNTVTLIAANQAGREQPLTFAVDYQPKPVERPLPPRKNPELIVVSIGVDNDKFSKIKSAELDANAVVHKFFKSNLIQSYYNVYPPEGAPTAWSPVIRVAKGASQGEVNKVFSALKARGKDGSLLLGDWGSGAPGAAKLGAGDTVVVAISSHVIDSRPASGTGQQAGRTQDTAQPRLVASDTLPASLETTGVDTDTITETLEELVKQGCRVLAIIDGFHDDDSIRESIAVREWAYRLDKAEVIVCLASRDLPSLPAEAFENSPFFKALVSMGDPSKWSDEERGRLTLDSFRRMLDIRVKEESNSRMRPFVSRPSMSTFSGSTPLFDPPPPAPSLANTGGGTASPRP